MAKEIKYGAEARNALQNGVNQLAGWTFYHLYEEIKEEHERMKQREDEQGKA